MFHPIGSQPPSVYWRRRLVVIASVVLLIVLLVLTVNAIRSDGNGQAQAGSPTSSAGTTHPSSSVPARSTTSSAPSSSTHKRSSGRSSGQHGSASKSTSAAPPADCAAGNLALKAVTQHTGYKVGDSPFVQLQVTNTGPKPCVQNLADKQVELRIYNGESRVWGSHDCKVAPGTAVRTLTPKVSVLVSIKWSGLTSQPGCAGTRQRVGAGTYTLYGSLSGHQAGATQFTIS